MKYPLSVSSWDGAEEAALHEVIESGMYSMGAQVAAYEQKFAQMVGSRYCVMTSSGSTANLLMIAALFFRKENPLKRGDEVIVPAVSWSTTYFPLQQYGLHVKFVDIDEESLNMDLEQLRSAVSDRTRVILTVNLLGNPNDFDGIAEIIGARDIVLLEDNCESMGAVFRGRNAGTFGVLGTFSSFFSHHISTMEGGCVVTDDEELHHILLSIRAHGWTRNLPEVNHVSGEKSSDPFEESFRFVLPGYNVRPLDMSGAVGLRQLEKLPAFIDQRRANATTFLSHFDSHPWIRVQREIGTSSWFGFAMILAEDAPIDQRELAGKLAAGGIECRPIVSGNFVKNEPVLKYFDYSVHDSLTNAETVDKRGLFVGNHHIDLRREIDHLFRVLDRIG